MRTRAGVSTTTFLASVVALLVIASAGYLLYLTKTPSTITVTVTSTSTETSTVSSTVTTTSGSAASGTITLPDGVGRNTNLSFLPATITVVRGVNNTITWIDQDSTPHTVTSTLIPSGANPFDSGTLNKGDKFTVTLTVPGTYEYHCSFHPGWMKGMITVVVGGYGY